MDGGFDGKSVWDKKGGSSSKQAPKKMVGRFRPIFKTYATLII